MFNTDPTTTQIIKTANGWLVVLPNVAEASIGGMMSNAFRDPKVIDALKDLQNQLGDETDEIMASISRKQNEENPIQKDSFIKPPALLKDSPNNNLYIFKTIDELTAFLKVRSGE